MKSNTPRMWADLKVHVDGFMKLIEWLTPFNGVLCFKLLNMI